MTDLPQVPHVYFAFSPAESLLTKLYKFNTPNATIAPEFWFIFFPFICVNNDFLYLHKKVISGIIHLIFLTMGVLYP